MPLGKSGSLGDAKGRTERRRHPSCNFSDPSMLEANFDTWSWDAAFDVALECREGQPSRRAIDCSNCVPFRREADDKFIRLSFCALFQQQVMLALPQFCLKVMFVQATLLEIVMDHFGERGVRFEKSFEL